MDIPLSSDALDLALHPGIENDLLAVGLISGKVQLIDLGAFSGDVRDSKGSGKRRKTDATDDDDGMEVQDGNGPVRTGKGKGKGKEKRLYEKKWSKRFNSKSCRGVEFNHDGSQLWSLSKDGTLYSLDTSTSSVVQTYPSAHSSAPSRLLPLPGDSNLIVTGDDDGVINLWDTRIKSTGETSTPIKSYDHHFDWITDFHYSSHLIPPKMSKEQKAKLERERKEREERKRKRKEKMAKYGRGKGRDESEEDSDQEEGKSIVSPARERLVCTSGDGSLSVIDLRAGGAKSKTTGVYNGPAPGVEVSEDQEDELLSITSVKNGGKLVVGTQLGLLSLWAPSRGLLDHIDRIPGHPASIDALLPLDSSTILTGSSDGLIRVVQILPHKFLGVVADHGMGLPVERMKRKNGLLVSCGHGGEVKVTDVSGLLDDASDDEEEEGSDGDDEKEDAETLARRLAEDDDSDSDEDEDDEDDDDDSEDLHAGLEQREGNEPSPEEEVNGPTHSFHEDDASSSSSSSSSSSTPPPPPPRKLTKKEKQRLATLSAGGTHRQEREVNDFFADL